MDFRQRLNSPAFRNCFLLFALLFLAQKAVALRNCECYNSTVRSSHTLEVVSDEVSYLGEGPYWDMKNNLLYYVDLRLGIVKKLNLATGETEQIIISKYQNQTVSIIIPYANSPGDFIITRQNQILKLNWPTKKTTVLVTLPEPTKLRFNDAKCDSRGRLYIGAFAEIMPSVAGIKTGTLYSLIDGKFKLLYDGFGVPNGMAFSADEKLFYMNDYKTQRIYVFDHDIETGALTNKRSVASFRGDKEFLPTQGNDGMVLNKFGFIWTAFGSKVVKIDPKMGCITDEVDLSSLATSATSLTYGTFKSRMGFFVTTRVESVPVDQLKSTDGKVLFIDFKGGHVYPFRPSEL